MNDDTADIVDELKRRYRASARLPLSDQNEFVDRNGHSPLWIQRPDARDLPGEARDNVSPPKAVVWAKFVYLLQLQRMLAEQAGTPAAQLALWAIALSIRAHELDDGRASRAV